MKLDYKKMIEEVDELVDSDFMFDMDCKSLPNSEPITQEEAEEMRQILLKIYRIAHCTTCVACQGKYLLSLTSKE